MSDRPKQDSIRAQRRNGDSPGCPGFLRLRPNSLPLRAGNLELAPVTPRFKLPQSRSARERYQA